MVNDLLSSQSSTCFLNFIFRHTEEKTSFLYSSPLLQVCQNKSPSLMLINYVSNGELSKGFFFLSLFLKVFL